MRINFTEAKKALAECHVSSDTTFLQHMAGVSKEYLINRAKEALNAAGVGERVEDNLKLVIQLANIARIMHRKDVANASTPNSSLDNT